MQSAPTADDVSKAFDNSRRNVPVEEYSLGKNEVQSHSPEILIEGVGLRKKVQIKKYVTEWLKQNHFPTLSLVSVNVDLNKPGWADWIIDDVIDTSLGKIELTISTPNFSISATEDFGGDFDFTHLSKVLEKARKSMPESSSDLETTPYKEKKTSFLSEVGTFSVDALEGISSDNTVTVEGLGRHFIKRGEIKRVVKRWLAQKQIFPGQSPIVNVSVSMDEYQTDSTVKVSILSDGKSLTGRHEGGILQVSQVIHALDNALTA